MADKKDHKPKESDIEISLELTKAAQEVWEDLKAFDATLPEHRRTLPSQVKIAPRHPRESAWKKTAVKVTKILLFIGGIATAVSIAIKDPASMRRAIEMAPSIPNPIEKLQQLPGQMRPQNSDDSSASTGTTFDTSSPGSGDTANSAIGSAKGTKYDPNRMYLFARPGELRQIHGSELQDPNTVENLESQGIITPSN